MAARSEQPTPCLCPRLLFAALHCLTIGLQQAAICVCNFVCRQPPGVSAGAAPPVRQRRADWEAYPMYDWSPLPSRLAACKALAGSSSEFVCRKYNRIRALCCTLLGLRSSHRSVLARQQGC